MSEHPLVAYPPSMPPRGEDLPYSDGKPMESYQHVDQMALLIRSLKDAWMERDDFFVGGNMFLYFSETQAKKNDFLGPDVFVVLGTRPHPRKSWVVWEEDGRSPDVVVELTSPTTEANDLGPKKEIYRNTLKVARYFVFHPIEKTFQGWALEGGVYVPLEPAEDGSLDCAPLGLRLGMRETAIPGGTEPMLRWIDAEGRVLPTANEVGRKTNEVEQALAATRREAQAAERRAEEAQEAAHAAQRDAEAERERAADAARRADAERDRAEPLARRLAELEGRLADAGE
ncbi:MAG: Uma2 family endonuclease [Deltaproteobacteria bacterium]